MSTHARADRFRRLSNATLLVAATAMAAPIGSATAAAQPQQPPQAQATAAAAIDARARAGLWDATVVVNGLEVPFRFEISPAGRGSFFDGERKVSSTQASLNGDALTLRFDQYLSVLDVTLTDGKLEGQYSCGKRGVYPFKAVRTAKDARVAAASPAPSIAGEYTIPTQSNKGEAPWRFIVRQHDAEVSAAILRVDGDTGTLTGTWRDGKLKSTHAGFPSPASGGYYKQARKDITALVERLLADRANSRGATAGTH